MAVEIGKRYNEMLQTAAALYKKGEFHSESSVESVIQEGYMNIACYSCLKGIPDSHIKIVIEDSRLRFHKNCIEFLVLTAQLGTKTGI